MKNPPCRRDCPQRSPDCHAWCLAYGEFRKEREATYRHREIQADTYDYVHSTIEKNMKKSKWRKS